MESGCADDMTYVYWIVWLLGLALQVLVIRALLQGSYTKFRFLLAFVIVVFLTSVIDGAAFLDLGEWRKQTRVYFWINDSIRQIMVFGLVFSLVAKAIAGSALARWRAKLPLLAFLLCAVAVWQAYTPDRSSWMTGVLRNISFGAAIINFLLWSALLASRDRDRRLLAVSGGLGLQMTGEAIGHSIRQLAIAGQTRWLATTGNFILLIAHLLCLFVWWQALRRTAEAPVAVRQTTTHGGR